MAGPGGGSSGGGFGGGSFGGGGFSGGRSGGFGGGSFSGGNRGGFGGGPHPPHHGPHFHGPRFHGPFRRVYYGGPGGGCISGIIIAVFVLFALVWIFGEPNGYNGYPSYQTEVVYDEATMQDYANDRYTEIFSSADGIEDNILLVFLTNDEANGYYTIAWVGDNVKAEINEMFGEYTEYGVYLNKYINDTYYAYTLDMNLTDVVTAMEMSVNLLELDSSFRIAPADIEGKKSEIINYTNFDLTEDYINAALESFTETTGIPMVIVVDRAEKVFGFDDYATVTVVESQTANVAVPDSEYVNDQGVVPSQNEAVTYDEGWVTADVVRVDYTKIIIATVAIVATAVVLIAWFRPMKNKKKSSDDGNGPKNDMPWES